MSDPSPFPREPAARGWPTADEEPDVRPAEFLDDVIWQARQLSCALPARIHSVGIIRTPESRAWAASTAVALASGLSERRSYTILANLEGGRRSLDRYLGLEQSAGLTDVVRGREVVASIAAPSWMYGFIYLPAGMNALPARDLLGSAALARLVRKVRSRGAVILLFAPEGMGRTAFDDAIVDGFVLFGRRPGPARRTAGGRLLATIGPLDGWDEELRAAPASFRVPDRVGGRATARAEATSAGARNRLFVPADDAGRTLLAAGRVAPGQGAAAAPDPRAGSASVWAETAGATAGNGPRSSTETAGPRKAVLLGRRRGRSASDRSRAVGTGVAVGVALLVAIFLGWLITQHDPVKLLLESPVEESGEPPVQEAEESS